MRNATICAALSALTLLSCTPSVTIKPTDHLLQGQVKTLNAEVKAHCGFGPVSARFRRAGTANWSLSSPPTQSGALYSSDVPGSDAFPEGETYEFRWDVQYSSQRESIFTSNCETVPPAIASAESAFSVPVCVPGTSATLAVPLHPQETNQWCWAASGEMVMHYLGNDVAQCTQANDRFGRSDCCDHAGGTCGSIVQTVEYLTGHGACIQPGWPDFGRYNFDSRFQAGALSWNELRRQLSDARWCPAAPVAFSWNWDGGGAHMMVARGFTEEIDLFFVALKGSFVLIHDPWDPCTGDSRIITYAEFVSRAGDHTHGRDYFDIRRRP